MGSLLDIVRQLRQGIWSSITGGWYYDPYHKVFTNTVHLYLWLFFLCLPFSIHLYFPPGSWFTWIYNGTIFFIFLFIKYINRTLHHLFDTGEVHEVTEGGVGDEIVEPNDDNIELQNMAGASVSSRSRRGTLDPARRTNLDVEAEADEDAGKNTQNSSSRFDLKVDVHSKPPESSVEEVDGAVSWDLPRPEEVIDIEKEKGDVVILVEEGGNQQHTAHSQTVLEETKHSGVSFDASQEVSFSTTSSQLTMSGMPRSDGNRRYSNISNLARSIRSEPGTNSLQPVSGSLEILAILDPNLSQLGNRRRNNQSKSGRNVRRTKSVLDTGLGCVAPMSVSSFPVSLDAGINTDFKNRKSATQPLKTLELKESQISEASEEGSYKDGEACTKGSDQDMASYEEQLAEATSALLTAGEQLATKPDDAKEIKPSNSPVHEAVDLSEREDEKIEDSLRKDENKLELSEISSTNDWDSCTEKTPEKNEPEQSADTRIEANDVEVDLTPTEEAKEEEEEIKRLEETEVKDMEDVEDDEDDDKTDDISKQDLDQTPSLLSTIGMDWLFSDSEPEEPPNSPKQVPSGADDRGTRKQEAGHTQARSNEPSTSKSRDSSHGSSGTDTETRTLLNKLEEVEASLEACGGAIPKRRLRGSGRRESRRSEANDAKLRGTEYEMPENSTLQEDAAGLKLFIDILSGQDSQNPEAEVELRKLIQKKRNRIREENKPQSEQRVRRRLAARRKRRHAAEPQTEDQFPPVEVPPPDDLPRQTRRRLRRERERESKETTHLAENHEDTSAGAVHCFQDEFGNWQTYTFGSETMTSTAVCSPLGSAGTPGSGMNSSRNLDNYLNRQFSGESTGSRRTSKLPDEDKGVEARVTGAENSVNYPQSHSSSDSGLTVILDSPAMVFQPNVDRQRSNDSNTDSLWPRSGTSRDRDAFFQNVNSGRYNVTASSQAFRRYNPLSMFTENLFQSMNTTVPEMIPYTPEGSSQLTRLDDSCVGRVNISSTSANIGSIHSATPKIKKYHLLPFPGTKGLKIWMDRLQLMNIMDQDPSLLHAVISVLLATATAVLGSQVIQEGYYKDLWLVLFCLVLCSSQYSLIKSVQPDACSPTHGFNATTVYSRPVYFIIMCSLVLILETVLKGEVVPFHLYNVSWGERDHLVVCRDVVYWVILAFPLIFTLGLLPQINTAAMFVMEQMDIQIFGGNASSSIQSSLYCVLRSILANVVLVGFAYGGLTVRTHSAHAQQVLFSIFCSLSVPLAYHLSRSSGDPSVVLSILKRHILAIVSEDSQQEGGRAPGLESPDPPTTNPEEDPAAPKDPLPKKLRDTVNSRLKNDLIVSLFTAIIVFLVVQSGVFDQTLPYADLVLWILALIFGLVLHYVLPHLRKENPWKCIAAPVLKSHEHGQFEVRRPARVMWWEKFLLWAVTVEKSVLYPLIFLSAVYQDKTVFSSLFGLWGGSLLMSICLLKCLRICFSDCSKQYMVLLLSVLIFQYNPSNASLNNLVVGNTRKSPFLLDYFLTSILVTKLLELYLKCQFVITYTAPHQINWGSAFHAFAQPFSVPHSAMLFLQTAVSSALSSPLNPFLGSTIFLCSYARPVKFWERNYNTKRVDNSNIRLSSQVEVRNPGADDNNLNSIFYEHLTRSLQHSLAGDIMLGRWGEVQQGDFFVLASDYLNCLVHIIELGNGLCTFQVRGLEFRGTYCHQREVEAISEGVEEDEGCCCCEPGHLPHMLSLNAALSQRWLAWEVSAVKYVLEGYSISDNSAQSMLQVYDLRKILVSYYIKSIIYYTVRSPKLQEWLSTPSIRDAIKTTAAKSFVDLDPLFNSNIDEDFDYRASGITRNSFCSVYLGWIQHCARARDRSIPAGKDSDLVSLCLALSVLGRRALGAAGHNAQTVEFFLVGLHSLFKGDFRITSVRDEWVFSDMELLRRVVAPGVRMSLKLHQDHFMSPDEYEDPTVLYCAITSHEKDLVISHEGDPAWRTAVLSGAPSLLALRHVVDDGSDEYKIIMLNKRYLSFRVIKLNRECVRGLWAGQQQELIFLRNRNPERGSIQNAKQALRNIINSSCDQPLGYPIYVSPLTTSYSDTNNQVTGVLGGPLSLGVFKSTLLDCWTRIRDKCVGSCSSGSAGVECDITSGDCVLPEMRGGSLPGNRTSVVSSVSKPSSGTLVSFAGLLGSQSLPVGSTPPSLLNMTAGGTSAPPTLADRPAEEDASGTPSVRSEKRSGPQFLAKIVDPLMVYDNINLGRRIDPVWPKSEWRVKGGRNSWNNWIPMEEMRGVVLHRWTPMHSNQIYRSHTDKTILLLKIEDKYVPIAEHGVEIIYQDSDETGSTGASPGRSRTDPTPTPESRREHTPVHDHRLRKRSGNKSDDSSKQRTGRIEEEEEEARTASPTSQNLASAARRHRSKEERNHSGEEVTSTRREEKLGVRTTEDPLSIYLRIQSGEEENLPRVQETESGETNERLRLSAQDTPPTLDEEANTSEKTADTNSPPSKEESTQSSNSEGTGVSSGLGESSWSDSPTGNRNLHPPGDFCSGGGGDIENPSEELFTGGDGGNENPPEKVYLSGTGGIENPPREFSYDKGGGSVPSSPANTNTDKRD